MHPSISSAFLALLLGGTFRTEVPNQTREAPRVFYHPVYAVRRPHAVGGAASGLRGNVETVTTALSAPIGTAYDAEDGHVYVLDVLPSQQIGILRVGPAAKTAVFKTLNLYSANGIAYDRASESFYVSSNQLSPAGDAPGLIRISSTGVVSTVAGGVGYGSNDGTGSAATFQSPSGIAVDTHDGALYLADYNSIRRVTTTGVVTTVVKPGAILSASASFGITYDPVDGNLYLASPADDTIYKVAPKSGSIVATAGQCYSAGIPTLGGCDPLQRDGRGRGALFNQPSGIAADSLSGSLYVTDSGNNAIRQIDLLGNVTTLAGSGVSGTVDGAGEDAEFEEPLGLTYAAASHTAYAINDSDGLFGDMAALRSITTTGSQAPPADTPITLFDTVSPDAGPYAIDWRPTKPASNALVYSEGGTVQESIPVQANGVPRIAEIATTGVSREHSDPHRKLDPVLGGPYDALYGADGSSWFFDQQALDGFETPQIQQLEHHSLTGGVGIVTLPVTANVLNAPGVNQLTLGPDGNVWFTISTELGGAVGFVKPSGAATTFPIQAGGGSIAFEADKKLWVSNTNGIVELDLSGRQLHSDAFAGVNYLTQGPDGNVWYSKIGAIGTIKRNNTIAEYPIYAPVPGCRPTTSCSRSIGPLTAGSDGALWFVESGQIGYATYGAIGRLTPDGAFSEFPVLAARSFPGDITGGPDGNVWFVDTGAQKIGRLKIR